MKIRFFLSFFIYFQREREDAFVADVDKTRARPRKNFQGKAPRDFRSICHFQASFSRSFNLSLSLSQARFSFFLNAPCEWSPDDYTRVLFRNNRDCFFFERLIIPSESIGKHMFVRMKARRAGEAKKWSSFMKVLLDEKRGTFASSSSDDKKARVRETRPRELLFDSMMVCNIGNNPLRRVR